MWNHWILVVWATVGTNVQPITLGGYPDHDTCVLASRVFEETNHTAHAVCMPGELK